jgi:archaellum biogenesis protein FlaJ (TadC family)
MKVINNAVSSLQCKMVQLKNKMSTMEFGDSQLVVALVLIAVALGLCLLFRTQIMNIMSNLFNTIGTQVANLANEPELTTSK